MHVTFSRRSDYAIRAVLDIARAHPDQRRKKREIAEAMNVPPTYLSQILAVLVRANVLVASAGHEGGYELARAPERIALLDVIEVFEGDTSRMQRCLLRGIPCGSDGTCAAHDAWLGAQGAMAASLAHATFADLVVRDRQQEAARADQPRSRRARS